MPAALPRIRSHNQGEGELMDDGSRAAATGRARVTIVDPVKDGPDRLMNLIGWHCDWCQQTVEEWVAAGGLN